MSGVSFEVRGGRALVLRGPNGSGKTTLLRTVAGYLPPASGTVRIASAQEAAFRGEDGAKGGGTVAACADGVFHYVGHANGVKPRLSVIENVSFWQSYYGGRGDAEAAEAALDAFGLLHLASFSAGHLSQGQARRLGLARLLAAPRPVWLLDEPQAALDAASTRLLEGAVASHLSSGGLAIVATHLDLALPDASILELGKGRPPQ